MLTLKLSLRDKQNLSYKYVQINETSNKVDNETVFHNCSQQDNVFKEKNNDLKDIIINKFYEFNNASTLKDDFTQPGNEAFIDNNSEPIIEFNFDSQFNRLTCQVNDSNKFDSIKQIDSENNKVIHDSNKRNDNSNNNNSSEQSNDDDIDLATIQMKNIIEIAKNIQATHQVTYHVFNTSNTLQSEDTKSKCDVLLELKNNSLSME